MKRSIICLAIMASGIQMALAQPGPPRNRDNVNERIEAQMVAFITQRLELTSEEAAEFWPIFNEFRKTEEEMRKAIEPDGSFVDMTEEDAKQFLTDQLRVDAELVDVRKEYVAKLQGVISSKKVVMLSSMEREFKRHVLERVREHRNKAGGGGRDRN